jgi:hypothetical protein
MSSTGASSIPASRWKPLVEYDQGVWLGVEAGCWVYGSPANPPRPFLSGGAAAFLLPLLDKPYPELASQLSAEAGAPQFLSQLATFALGDPTVPSKWKEQANAWFAAGCPLTDEA